MYIYMHSQRTLRELISKTMRMESERGTRSFDTSVSTCGKMAEGHTRASMDECDCGAAVGGHQKGGDSEKIAQD